jgi:hypothetical protein
MTGKHLPNERTVTAARQAIEEGRTAEARHLLEQAIRVDDQDPRPWLLLAGIAATPRERRVMLAQAKRLDTGAAIPVRSVPAGRATSSRRRVRRQAGNRSAGMWLLILLLLAGMVGVAGFHPSGRALVEDLTGRALPATNGGPLAMDNPAPAQPILEANLPSSEGLDGEPIVQPAGEIPVTFPTKDASLGSGPLPTWTPTPLPTPTLAPTLTPSPTSEPSPTPEPIPLLEGAAAPRPAGVGEGERWINVNLSSQTLVAYEGDTPVFETLVSSGTWQYPTVTGQFRTYIKYESQTMNGYLLGYDYYLPDVPYVMYFYRDYAIHGTYWHNNFGTPMSHGCVNVYTPDAEWLFNWAPIGTLVNVHQ